MREMLLKLQSAQQQNRIMCKKRPELLPWIQQTTNLLSKLGWDLTEIRVKRRMKTYVARGLQKISGTISGRSPEPFNITQREIDVLADLQRETVPNQIWGSISFAVSQLKTERARENTPRGVIDALLQHSLVKAVDKVQRAYICSLCGYQGHCENDCPYRREQPKRRVSGVKSTNDAHDITKQPLQSSNKKSRSSRAICEDLRLNDCDMTDEDFDCDLREDLQYAVQTRNGKRRSHSKGSTNPICNNEPESTTTSSAVGLQDGDITEMKAQ